MTMIPDDAIVSSAAFGWDAFDAAIEVECDDDAVSSEFVKRQ